MAGTGWLILGLDEDGYIVDRSAFYPEDKYGYGENGYFHGAIEAAQIRCRELTELYPGATFFAVPTNVAVGPQAPLAEYPHTHQPGDNLPDTDWAESFGSFPDSGRSFKTQNEKTPLRRPSQ